MPRPSRLTRKRIHRVSVCLDNALKAERLVVSPLRGQTSADLIRRMTHETNTGLADLLRAFFIRDAHAINLLKGLNGKLDQKIALVSALGIYWRDQRDDADLLKNIRNRIAHRNLSGSFRAKDLAELVDRLHYARVHPGHPRRVHFIQTAARIVSRTRVAMRMVKAMHREELSLRELRALFSEPSVFLRVEARTRSSKRTSNVRDEMA
jgi:hypothetical protein